MRVGRIVQALDLIVLRMCHPVLSACGFRVVLPVTLPIKPGLLPLLPLKKAGLRRATHFQKSSNDECNIAILTAQASRHLYPDIYTKALISERASIRGRRAPALHDGKIPGNAARVPRHTPFAHSACPANVWARVASRRGTARARETRHAVLSQPTSNRHKRQYQ